MNRFSYMTLMFAFGFAFVCCDANHKLERKVIDSAVHRIVEDLCTEFCADEKSSKGKLVLISNKFERFSGSSNRNTNDSLRALKLKRLLSSEEINLSLSMAELSNLNIRVVERDSIMPKSIGFTNSAQFLSRNKYGLAGYCTAISFTEPLQFEKDGKQNIAFQVKFISEYARKEFVYFLVIDDKNVIVSIQRMQGYPGPLPIHDSEIEVDG